MKLYIWDMREARGVSLVGLSELTGISKSTLSRIENGERSPTLDQLEAIAKALECYMSELYYSEYM